MRRNATLTLLIATLALTGCANKHTPTESAVGGAAAGAFVGGTIGTICCGPVTGLPAGILIGGAAGAVGGYVWPTKE
jgi:hypothetical protein